VTIASPPSRQLAALGPLAQLRAGRLGSRMVRLFAGLVLYGVSMAVMIRSQLGQLPWDVLHVGLARHLPLSIGETIIAASFVVLLLWLPLRQAPGFGTVANAVVIGLVTDLVLHLLAVPGPMALRIALMLGGVLLNGVATALYIGSQLGPGPRDGLMTGLHRRTGLSLRVVRTSIEVAVVIAGWSLGGLVGVGTVLYAIAIGPLTQALLPHFIVDLPREGISASSR
jgi:uncharacterized membrane protein YczE